MTVLLFAGMFAKGLRESAGSIPDFMRSEWPCPYEKILAEAAGLYYFYMVKDHLPKLQSAMRAAGCMKRRSRILGRIDWRAGGRPREGTRATCGRRPHLPYRHKRVKIISISSNFRS